MKRTRLVVSFILGLLWLFLIRKAQNIDAGLAALLLMPHYIFIVLGVIFNGVGMFYGAGWPAITAGIMYVIAIVFCLPIGTLLIVPGIAAIICFTASRRADSPSENTEPLKTTEPQVIHVIHHYENGEEREEIQYVKPNNTADSENNPANNESINEQEKST